MNFIAEIVSVFPRAEDNFTLIADQERLADESELCSDGKDLSIVQLPDVVQSFLTVEHRPG